MKKKKLPTEIYLLLRSRILGFKLLPGVKISDKAIAEELGVSRTPVREALIRLVSHGLVTSLHNRGFTVREFSIKDVKDIYTLREALEVLAVRLAIENIDERKIEKIQKHLTAYPRLIASRNRQHFNQTDEEFHMMIARFSDNKPLEKQLNSLHDQLAVLRRHAHLLSEHIRDAYEEETYIQHNAIFECMADRNESAAVDAVSKHVRESMKDVINVLTKNSK
ncbi:conserved hypothetical protein [Desulfamplus magnetovallimortis]|uniref:HTH gntR-type domain-containing protein n=1 Tax=Desulfamplus magnetovallimortis TaxID=1246637 RepID=A0A1W1HAZ2_9BACT|nr:GntR family transcriptional regulator [Desulfamplus magnetovallimortis]SLM29609.1 conserved hypothetical protein [Desulfamplus magnetovallimortis]